MYLEALCFIGVVVFIYGAHLTVSFHGKADIESKYGSALRVFYHWVSAGLTLIAEFEMIGIFLSELGSLLLGLIVLASRLVHGIVAWAFIKHLVMNKETEHSQKMDLNLVREHRLYHDALLLITALEFSFVVYLPWFKTQFSEEHRGYPTLHLLKAVTYTAFSQALVGCVAPSVWLAYSATSADPYKVRSILFYDHLPPPYRHTHEK